MLGLKLIHVSKRCPLWLSWYQWSISINNGFIQGTPKCTIRSKGVFPWLFHWLIQPERFYCILTVNVLSTFWTLCAFYKPGILRWGGLLNRSSWKTRTCLYAHDDVIKWNNFPRCWPFVRGIHRSPVNSPHKGQWRRALMSFLICVWTIVGLVIWDATTPIMMSL